MARAVVSRPRNHRHRSLTSVLGIDVFAFTSIETEAAGGIHQSRFVHVQPTSRRKARYQNNAQIVCKRPPVQFNIGIVPIFSPRSAQHLACSVVNTGHVVDVGYECFVGGSLSDVHHRDEWVVGARFRQIEPSSVHIHHVGYFEDHLVRVSNRNGDRRWNCSHIGGRVAVRWPWCPPPAITEYYFQASIDHGHLFYGYEAQPMRNELIPSHLHHL